MAQKTSIEWTDYNWNPIRGCSRVSPGCDNCYAMNQAHRFSGVGMPYEGLTVLRNENVDWSSKIMLVEKDLLKPLHWTKPRKIFVASMSDPFHHNVPDAYLDKMFAVMALTPRHTYQLLTKRPERMKEYFASHDWMGQDRVTLIYNAAASIVVRNPRKGGYNMPLALPIKNVWLGVSCEDQKAADERIPLLLQTPAAVRWVSAEPLLGPIEFDLWQMVGADTRTLGRKLDWIVIGGESGPHARSFNIQWARDIILQCKAANVPAFVKQLGSKPTSIIDRISHPHSAIKEPDGFYRFLNHSKGGDITEWPEDLRVREYPRQG